MRQVCVLTLVLTQGWLYIVTNADGADDFKVVRTRVGSGRECWEDVVPAREGVQILDLDMFQVCRRRNRVFHLSGF